MKAKYYNVEERFILEKVEGVEGYYLNYFIDEAISFTKNVNEAVQFESEQGALNTVVDIRLAGFTFKFNVRKIVTTVEVF